MQTLEKGKENIKTLLENYGPVGPRHLLAAALLMHPREEEKNDRNEQPQKKADKVAA